MNDIFKSIHDHNMGVKNKMDNFNAELEKGREALTGGSWKTLSNREHVYIKGGKKMAKTEKSIESDMDIKKSINTVLECKSQMDNISKAIEIEEALRILQSK
jgi:hypothetical protein